MTTSKNFTKQQKLGFSEEQILASAQGPLDRNPLTIRCLNSTAHKHGDRKPSAYYYQDTGFYGCHGCSLHGFADDRDNKGALRPYLPLGIGKTSSPLGVVAIYSYSKTQRVVRYHPKSFRPQYHNGQKWVFGIGDGPWRPYHFHLINDQTQHIYIVEGEKDGNRLHQILPPYEVAITSR